MMALALDVYENLKSIIYANSGMALKGDKRDFLARRVAMRMLARNIRTDKDYCRYLRLDPHGDELAALIELVVIGETYFFCEYNQLRLFAEDILPLMAARAGKAAGQRRLRILSAGCATGEEPYTLAIILKEMLDDTDRWTIDITGVDINQQSLDKGSCGRYSDHAMRETPYIYRDRYFQSSPEGWLLRPNIRQMVSWSRVNLYDPAQTRLLKGYDVIFCRNVLIYFDMASAGQVLENLYQAMNPGGYIFAGTAESISRLTDLFEVRRFKQTFVYNKPGMRPI